LATDIDGSYDTLLVLPVNLLLAVGAFSYYHLLTAFTPALQMGLSVSSVGATFFRQFVCFQSRTRTVGFS